MESILIKNQKKRFKKYFSENSQHYEIIAEVRYDDECGNGHNTFAITGEIWKVTSLNHKRMRNDCECCGCLHEDIAKHFPNLKKYLKWHLCGSQQPMYYIENSMYWAGHRGFCDGKKDSPPNYEHFRSTAIWPEVSDEFIKNSTEDELKNALMKRLPLLMEEFKKDVESFGFTY